MRDFLFHNDKSARNFIIMTGIVFLGIGLFSIFVYDLEDVFASTPNSEINQIDQISVDDNLTKTIKVKLQDGISSSDEIH